VAPKKGAVAMEITKELFTLGKQMEKKKEKKVLHQSGKHSYGKIRKKEKTTRPSR